MIYYKPTQRVARIRWNWKKRKKKEINNIPGKLLSACLTACVIEDNRPAELFLFIELSTSVLCDDREFLSE